jgi:hypothetical protein
MEKIFSFSVIIITALGMGLAWSTVVTTAYRWRDQIFLLKAFVAMLCAGLSNLFLWWVTATWYNPLRDAALQPSIRLSVAIAAAAPLLWIPLLQRYMRWKSEAGKSLSEFERKRLARAKLAAENEEFEDGDN